ncbi:Zinc finger, CCHC-type [Dillenia turbinata]|uniref:Zinc finger, CCHC-type n=1 Tax=Dillenia turbinata TaxID=194707 RepID=A0AAN8ZF05_9MAGN
MALKGECFHCKKMGHWIKDCPDKKKEIIERERMPSIKTFFCRTLPSLPSNMPLVNDLKECNNQASNFQPSCPGSPDDAQEDNLEDSIHKAFSQAALQVQSKLLCRLEFMDPLEHATMEREANIAFSALNSLKVNYGPFAEHIREFICSAKSLAEIDASICREDASERLEHEKVCRDNLSHLHAEITNELGTSREQVQSLCEEENRLRNKLLQIETQRTQHEDKAKNLEDRLVKISEQMLESECRLQAATQEVDKAMKFQQQREMGQDAMKKAMKNARACLT